MSQKDGICYCSDDGRPSEKDKPHDCPEKAKNKGRMTDLFSIERGERRLSKDKRKNPQDRRVGRWHE
jgi:hypothetical protein